uniref:Uncharacterized protein n=1 Tax=Nothoprocta perdicaria TaxID=30464 RepID=A0A8C6Z1A5_NOTPE
MAIGTHASSLAQQAFCEATLYSHQVQLCCGEVFQQPLYPRLSAELKANTEKEIIQTGARELSLDPTVIWVSLRGFHMMPLISGERATGLLCAQKPW